MFALVAAILLAVVAFGGHLGSINLFYLALAFWALHFAVSWTPWVGWRRQP